MTPALEHDGFELRAGLLDADDVAELSDLFGSMQDGQPGVRLPPRAVVHCGAMRRVQSILGSDARPVRVVLFDKRDGGNWSLGWHQDRTIEVQEQHDVPGFDNWTIKQGRIHVSPPADLLSRMITVRLHIDPVDADNAPLLVAPGSHRDGLIREDRIAATVERTGQATCLADAGDAWLYSTLIVHASARAAAGRRRRVVQIDFSADPLPGGLQWADAG